MLKFRETSCRVLFLAMFMLAIGMHPACAHSEFERGYREGYGKGYQDALNASQQGLAPRQSAGPPGIVVIRAWYGDDNKSCNLTAWAAKHFNSRTSGEIEVSNDICGDPSPGNRKSLHVEFLCNGQTKSVEAYEHRRLSLYCH